jgi:membrane protein YqaA with SNARE-associated domain
LITLTAVLDLAILFAWSFAASTVLPLSSEVPLIVTVRRAESWILPVAVATAGNYLGACTTYWLARVAVDRTVRHPSPRAARATGLISKYGPPALLLSWVPLVGDALVALAGAAHMPFAPFSLWTLLGKAARYAVLGWLVN